MESLSDCVMLLDYKWRFTYINSRAQHDLAKGADVIGKILWEVFPQAQGTEFEDCCGKAMHFRVTQTLVTSFPPLSTNYEAKIAPLSNDGICIWLRNLHDKKIYGVDLEGSTYWRREAQLNNIFDQSLVGIMACTPDGRPTMINRRFCEILGRSFEDLQNCTVGDYTHPDDLTWNLPLLETHLKDGTPFQIEKRYIRPDGSIAWCLVNVSFVLGYHQEVESALVVAQDISHMKKTASALEKSEALYRSVLETSQDCIKIIDLDGRVELMNGPGLCAMEIENFDSVRGGAWVDFWPIEDRGLVETAFLSAIEGKATRFSAMCPTAAGTRKWWDVMVAPMLDERDGVSKILAISRDITAQRTIAAQARWDSDHDSLTGLANRKNFETRLKAATIRVMQRETKVGLLLIDLDHFKHVNDALGHAAGDHLLRVFGKRLNQSFRGEDFVARLGGDEFAVIIESRSKNLDLLKASQSIYKRLNKPIIFEGRAINTSASIGCAIYPDDADSANDLFNNANIALYAMKKSGRSGVKIFQQVMREEAIAVSRQLSAARTAITPKFVEPHYQQKIDLDTGKIVGFEALLRWRDAAHGLQTPDTVSEAFNDYELASKIGDLMQRRVFSDVRGWLSRGLPIGFVAINAAPVEFLRDDFAERLKARIREYDIPPQFIEIEITEHVFSTQSSNFVRRAIDALSDLGVRIALDDFGTGYSSLSHLRDYPVDVLKIDRSFIAKITENNEVKSIVFAMLDLAKSLNIDVVAEGIEKEDQMKVLIQRGCKIGQGFLFGRPVSAGEVPSLLVG
jgi:diguanylate cyclase (GGDEF)-like protein/PAS domain S-box-containing protein